MTAKKAPLVFCLLSVAAFGGASEGRAEARSLSDLAFLTGCWKGQLPGEEGTIEERFNAPTAGLILGTSQTVAGGKTKSFEFMRIEQTGEGIVMTPAPMGNKSVPFKLVGDGRGAVFENLEHDFPKRIIYRLREDGSLVARIEGEKAEQAQEFVMAAVPCAAASLATYRLQWGESGRDLGQYDNPTALALFKDAFGVSTLVFADTNHHRIRSYTWNGMFIDKWGEEGDGPGEFLFPKGIAVNSRKEVVIADSGNHRIQVTTGSPDSLTELPGQFLFAFGKRGGGPGDFEEPSGVALDREDNIYVADSGNHRIQKFDAQGKWVASWGEKGQGPGQFDRPLGLAIDPARGWIYVVDTDNARVQKLDRNGKFLLAWGRSGMKEGELYRPKGMAVGPDGSLYIADSNNHRIQKFDSDGAFLGSFGSRGMEDGELWFPFGVVTDGEGRLFVTDSENGRIQMFRENPQVARFQASRTK
jgi:DNA-binding beta-propeller fold protein YncE